MEGTAVLERLTLPRVPLTWRLATVRRLQPETPSATTLTFDVPDWPGHLAGQHVDVRLTAEDGYQAERSCSSAAAQASSPSWRCCATALTQGAPRKHGSSCRHAPGRTCSIATTLP